MDTRTRNDLVWIVVLAAVTTIVAHSFWGVGWGLTIATVVVVSLVRLVYAWYARRTWR
jgi:L-cystine uptake protein TcyP (sodium:dicarboxylate symporter family)